jgi:hypothetical protein
MPTSEQLRAWADDFERVYPEEWADRLRWFVEELGVSQSHLLRLMGVSREEVERLADRQVDWGWAVEHFGEEPAIWAESTIAQALVRFRYDWRGLKDRLSRPVDEEFELAQPGGRYLALRDWPPDRLEEALLVLIAQDGPQSTSALIAYLSQPDTVPARS